jgi:hypothetical protein
MKEMRKSLPLISALLIAVIFLLPFYEPANAQGLAPRRLIRWIRPVLGKVLEKSEASLTIEKRDGDQLIFKVTKTTRFQDQDKTELDLNEIETGDWVVVLSAFRAVKNPTARVVVLLPEDFSPETIKVVRGRIRTVTDAKNQFSLQTRDGELEVRVDLETVYQGKVSSFSELKEGMLVGVGIKKDSSEALLAAFVRAGFPFLQVR